MPSNIEIKARAPSWNRQRKLVERMTAAAPIILHQIDTFFPCQEGRLKVRQLSENKGELIYYRRPDTKRSKESHYVIFRTGSPVGLCSILTAALGVSVIVEKTRRLYHVGQTRVHLDDVAGLGRFLELEVVLNEGQRPQEGHRIASELMAALEIHDHDLVDCSYADLIQAGERMKRAAAATTMRGGIGG